jgi:hypothetical protein
MEFNFTDEDKKTLNVLRARCKVAGLGDGIIREFRIDENGAGWVDLSEATPDEMFNIELGLLNEGAFE